MEMLDINFENGLNRIEKILKEMIINNAEDNSQNLLDALRKFVDVVIYKIYVKKSGESHDYSYQNYRDFCSPYMSKQRNKYKELLFFHDLLNITTSHYFMDENSACLLVRKYYDYLLLIKEVLKNEFNLYVFQDIDKIKFDDEIEFGEYYEKINQSVKNVDLLNVETFNDKYYVLNEKLIRINNEKFYEITLINALFTHDKFNRFVVFSKNRIGFKYAVNIYYKNTFIAIEGNKVPIKIIVDWSLNIRECEFKNLFKLLNLKDYNVVKNKEYFILNKYMKENNLDLLDIVLLDKYDFFEIKNSLLKNLEASHIFDCLEKIKHYIDNNLPGTNLLKYILYTMNNDFIKSQLCKEMSNPVLSDLNVYYESIPFDTMPLAMSPKDHILNFSDLIKVFSIEGREHELLAHIIKSNTENKNRLYTSEIELEEFSNIDKLITDYNNRLYYKHRPNSELVHSKGYVFFYGKEKDTLDIVLNLKELSQGYISNHQIFIDEFLKKASVNLSYSEEKLEILKELFKDTRVTIISGPAGTGKSTFIKLVNEVYQSKNRKHLFLSQTNSAINHLKNITNSSQGEYYTIASFLGKKDVDKYSIIFIDECSVISNKDMIQLLKKVKDKYSALLLSGDEYQIESISYGNWFRIAKSVFDNRVVHELKGQYRSKNTKLLDLWDSCRNGDGKTLDLICNSFYHSESKKELFFKEPNIQDEIVLCLNYDGLYGINNLNAFFQAKNTSKAFGMKDWVFKVGDPILFNDSKRFAPIIFNNLKGIILDIAEISDRFTFTIKIDNVISFFDELPEGLKELPPVDGKSVVQFDVFKQGEIDSNYEIDDERKIVPFQIAYVISIHKAQGLEYDSVKVVFSDNIEKNITPNIFYTAITRAKSKLKIYCSNKAILSITSKIETEYNDDSDIKTFKKFNGKELYK